MKKRVWIIPLLLCLAAALVVGTITVSKYVLLLQEKEANFTVPAFYFRSNVLTDEADPEPIAVIGKTTEFVLSNGADQTHFTDADVSYEVTYHVQVDGSWVAVSDLSVAATLTGGAYSTASITATPVAYDHDEDGSAEIYNDVMVQATASAPQSKTLYARFQFAYSGMRISYEYDRDYGLLAMVISTNDDAGEYVISWSALPGILPDNADPNGILTNVLATDTQVQATLEPHTVYRLYFMVPAAMRPSIDAMIENMDDDQVVQQIAQFITCTPK